MKLWCAGIIRWCHYQALYSMHTEKNYETADLVKFKKSIRLTFTGVTCQYVRAPRITCRLWYLQHLQSPGGSTFIIYTAHIHLIHYHWCHLPVHPCSTRHVPSHGIWYLQHLHVIHTLTRSQHFCMKWCHGRHLKSVTSNQKSDSVNRYVFTGTTFTAKFHPDPIWNNGSLSLFWRGHPNKNNNNKNKMSSNMRSVHDLKIKRVNQLTEIFVYRGTGFQFSKSNRSQTWPNLWEKTVGRWTCRTRSWNSVHLRQTVSENGVQCKLTSCAPSRCPRSSTTTCTPSKLGGSSTTSSRRSSWFSSGGSESLASTSVLHESLTVDFMSSPTGSHQQLNIYTENHPLSTLCHLL